MSEVKLPGITTENDIIRAKLREMAKNLNVNDICKHVLDDDRFFIWSGSSKPEKHHYGNGGLAKHTWEVIRLCGDVNNNLKLACKGCDSDKLFIAALFHDVGKIHDYEYVDPIRKWITTPHKYNIHHISKSALILDRAWFKTYGDQHETIKEQILHAILSHHGLREWGSPVRPNSEMAWILHLCDCISARTEECYNVRMQSISTRPDKG